jgi:hypothetical protein
MATKTTGAEFKRFYIDPKYWPPEASQASSEDNVWHEDATILVNGEETGPTTDLMAMPDSADVRIEGGIVLGPRWKNDDEPSFETYFKRWRKEQATKSFVVECDDSKLEAVLAAIKAAGGKVVK